MAGKLIKSSPDIKNQTSIMLAQTTLTPPLKKNKSPVFFIVLLANFFKTILCKVVNIIAKNVTADYLKAVNANLSKAQIEELSTARIRCTGILEASQLDIDVFYVQNAQNKRKETKK